MVYSLNYKVTSNLSKVVLNYDHPSLTIWPLGANGFNLTIKVEKVVSS